MGYKNPYEEFDLDGPNSFLSRGGFAMPERSGGGGFASTDSLPQIPGFAPMMPGGGQQEGGGFNRMMTRPAPTSGFGRMAPQGMTPEMAPGGAAPQLSQQASPMGGGDQEYAWAIPVAMGVMSMMANEQAGDSMTPLTDMDQFLPPVHPWDDARLPAFARGLDQYMGQIENPDLPPAVHDNMMRMVQNAGAAGQEEANRAASLGVQTGNLDPYSQALELGRQSYGAEGQYAMMNNEARVRNLSLMVPLLQFWSQMQGVRGGVSQSNVPKADPFSAFFQGASGGAGMASAFSGA